MGEFQKRKQPLNLPPLIPPSPAPAFSAADEIGNRCFRRLILCILEANWIVVSASECVYDKEGCTTHHHFYHNIINVILPVYVKRVPLWRHDTLMVLGSLLTMASMDDLCLVDAVVRLVLPIKYFRFLIKVGHHFDSHILPNR